MDTKWRLAEALTDSTPRNEEPRTELTRCGAFVYISRGERIRTSDLLLPKQWAVSFQEFEESCSLSVLSEEKLCGRC